MIRAVASFAFIGFVASGASAKAVAPVETARFSFSADGQSAPEAEQLASTAEQDRTAVALELGADYDGRTTVHVVADRTAFDALQPANQPVPTWVTAAFDPGRNEITLLAESQGERAAFQGALFGLAAGRLGQGRVPRWMLAGRAVLRAGDGWERQGPSLLRAGRTDALIPLGELATSFPANPLDAALAWAESASAVRFIGDRYGHAAVTEIVQSIASGSSFDGAVNHVLGGSPRNVENAWRRSGLRWVIAMDFLTNENTLWGFATLLLALAFWRTHRRKNLRLRLLAFEEKAEEARRLLRTPAAWADEPRMPRVPAETPTAGSRALSIEDDGAEAPKKPTLH